MKEKTYWKWKNTIIDFKTLSNDKNNYGGYITKKDMVFQYLGTPDEEIHEWYNGGWSSEYNEALRYAKELGLVEDYIDYEEIRFENNELKEGIKNIIFQLEHNPRENAETRDNYIIEQLKKLLESKDE
ncbi:MAG: hypothetical protein J6T10_21635 [Methanobrevibacter sp.]|nr:hypothetical protein [Methanobrevibacter sp.]